MDSEDFGRELWLVTDNLRLMTEAIARGVKLKMDHIEAIKRDLRTMENIVQEFVDSLPKCPVCFRPILNNKCCNDMTTEERINRILGS